MHISNLAKKANLDITKYNKKEIIDGFETEKDIAIAFTRYCRPQIFFLRLFKLF